MREQFPREPVSTATVARALIMSAIALALAVSMALLLATTVLPVAAP